MRRNFRQVTKGEFDAFLLTPGPWEPIENVDREAVEHPEGTAPAERWHLSHGGALVAYECNGEFFVIGHALERAA